MLRSATNPDRIPTAEGTVVLVREAQEFLSSGIVDGITRLK